MSRRESYCSGERIGVIRGQAVLDEERATRQSCDVVLRASVALSEASMPTRSAAIGASDTFVQPALHCNPRDAGHSGCLQRIAAVGDLIALDPHLQDLVNQMSVGGEELERLLEELGLGVEIHYWIDETDEAGMNLFAGEQARRAGGIRPPSKIVSVPCDEGPGSIHDDANQTPILPTCLTQPHDMRAF